jgi:signal recognition particle GTPase
MEDTMTKELPQTSKPELIGPFQEAKNQQAFLKMGVMGFAGSGKTYTSALIAKGIWERLKEKKPVFFMDTETGSDFLVPKFKEWKVPFFVSKSRAFTDLMDGVRVAEKNAGVLIIDSISHFWKEVQDAYKKAHNRNRLLFQDWLPF